MSLAIQFNLNNAAALDGATELPFLSSGQVTKTVDADGIVMLEVNAAESFGLSDSGRLLGSSSGDLVPRSLQVSSTGTAGAGTDTVASVGLAPPDATDQRFVFHTLTCPIRCLRGAQIMADHAPQADRRDLDALITRNTFHPVTLEEQ